MQNNIVIAEHAGFCFGVKRATDSVEKRIGQKSDNERLFTLGHLIHNDGYNLWLESKGVHSIDVDDIEKIVIIELGKKFTDVLVQIRSQGVHLPSACIIHAFETKIKRKYNDFITFFDVFIEKFHLQELGFPVQ